MNMAQPNLPAKIVINFEHRADGGLTVYSDDVPGFVLSHVDSTAVLSDVKPALERILSHMFGVKVVVEELSHLRTEPIPTQREYVTFAAA
jgi:hypothetical protein